MAPQQRSVALTERWSRERLEGMLAGYGEGEAKVLRLIWERAEDRASDERSDGMKAVSHAVRGIVSELGLPPIHLLEELNHRWEELAGPQWGSNGVPIVVRHGELVVEAADRRIVRWLRHDTGRLVERLAEHFGSGFVTKVHVVSPPERRS